MIVSKISENTSPLCYLPDGRLVCYHRGNICVLNDGKGEKKFTIPISVKERLLGWNRYATRLFRFGIRSAIAIDNEHIVISIGNMLHEVYLVQETITKGWFCGEGIRPLILTDVKNIDGFDDGIYFGGYLSNFDKKPVSVYRRTGVDNWQVVYTFPQGAINHVHNIVADPYRKCLWVFTGDFDNASAIWRVSDNFNKVECIASNDQKYRGCVVFALPEGLLYATDTPFADNHIYLLKESGELEILGDLSGSCIYGCQWKKQYVFSSTVEADGRDETLMKLLFSKKRGAGIKDQFVRLYIGDIANGFIEAYKDRKDSAPYLFQFGVFKFPAGTNISNTLVFLPVGTSTHDNCLLLTKDSAPFK